ncbi:hypothetical protein [Baekduia sp. Peel2402]|uniref:hypothetical protein n=1 Tax=Baekduia sp. Peel2402 TaxID=3458296 RepID=UPI00403EBA79
MPASSITVVADAGPTVGLGHLSRAGAVAAALRVQGHEVLTRTLRGGAVEHDGIAWMAHEGVAGDGPLLVDAYGADLAALGGGRPVATFWDGVGDPPDDAALAITLSGPDGVRLACLRPMFWGGGAPRPVAEVARRVLVTTGGGAAGGAGALAAAVRDAVAAAPGGVEVALLLGPYATEEPPDGVEVVRAPERMVDVLQAADVVVSAAGQTMLEALCAGTPCVALAVVDNQRAQLRRVGDAVRAVADVAGAAAATAELLGDATARRALASAGRELVDGFGALRVAARVAAL